jgi:nitrate reductase cytochrome c-type subunit
VATILANNSFNSRKWSKHLTIKHESYANKPFQFIERKLHDIRRESNLMRHAVVISTKALQAFVEVSYVTAESKKPHTIVEIFLLLAAMNMCLNMHGKNIAKLLVIPVYNHRVILCTE